MKAEYNQKSKRCTTKPKTMRKKPLRQLPKDQGVVVRCGPPPPSAGEIENSDCKVGSPKQRV